MLGGDAAFLPHNRHHAAAGRGEIPEAGHPPKMPLKLGPCLTRLGCFELLCAGPEELAFRLGCRLPFCHGLTSVSFLSVCRAAAAYASSLTLLCALYRE